MKCPQCINQPLAERMGPKGVLIDLCPSCGGVWLDKGEIYYYVRDPKKLHAAFGEAYRRPAPSRYLCRRCDVQLLEAKFPDGGPMIDACKKCGGTWFDKGEVAALNAILDRPVAGDSGPIQERGAPSEPRPVGAAFAAVVALPSLALRSAVVMASLYGVLAGLCFIAAAYLRLGVDWALGFAALGVLLQFALGPFFMDLGLRWAHRFRWVQPQELPPQVRDFIAATCEKHKIPFPSCGIIDDSTPNAFTYGHTPRNARLVVTRGILELLDPDESEGVIGHELGHILHWDMLIMTAAALVPTLLYALYRLFSRLGRGSRSSSGKKGNPFPMLAIAAFVLYYITHHLVLFLSRIRELHADRFAGQETGKPNALATALVKIAYGLAGRKDAEADFAPARTLGLFDPIGAQSLVASSLAPGGGLSKENTIAAMQWDMWNPWAAYYELKSTHPLPARRIEMLGALARSMGQVPSIAFDAKQPESYWDEFFVDLFALWAPWLGAALVLGVQAGKGPLEPGLLWHLVVGWGFGNLYKLWFKYDGGFFPDMTVAALLKNVKVSGVRGVPAVLTGKVLGRGVPGYILSEDIVLQDETGYIFVDYRQPLGLWQWLFALTRVGNLVGQEITVSGWYRRSPVPYFELASFEAGGSTTRCWSRHAEWAVTIAVLLFGAAKGLGAL